VSGPGTPICDEGKRQVLDTINGKPGMEGMLTDFQSESALIVVCTGAWHAAHISTSKSDSTSKRQ
jgi:hypothetical protein